MSKFVEVLCLKMAFCTQHRKMIEIVMQAHLILELCMHMFVCVCVCVSWYYNTMSRARVISSKPIVNIAPNRQYNLTSISWYSMVAIPIWLGSESLFAPLYPCVYVYESKKYIFLLQIPVSYFPVFLSMSNSNPHRIQSRQCTNTLKRNWYNFPIWFVNKFDRNNIVWKNMNFNWRKPCHIFQFLHEINHINSERTVTKCDWGR